MPHGPQKGKRPDNSNSSSTAATSTATNGIKKTITIRWQQQGERTWGRKFTASSHFLLVLRMLPLDGPIMLLLLLLLLLPLPLLLLLLLYDVAACRSLLCSPIIKCVFHTVDFGFFMRELLLLLRFLIYEPANEFAKGEHENMGLRRRVGNVYQISIHPHFRL